MCPWSKHRLCEVITHWSLWETFLPLICPALCWVARRCHGSLTLDQVLCVKIVWFVSALTGISMLFVRGFKMWILFSWKSHFLVRARTSPRHLPINLNSVIGWWHSVLTLLCSLPQSMGHYCFMVSCPVSWRKGSMGIYSLNSIL